MENLDNKMNLIPVADTKDRFSYRIPTEEQLRPEVSTEHSVQLKPSVSTYDSTKTTINSLSANDKMTLELLTNRNQYRKCLSYVNPDKYTEIQTKLQKHKLYFSMVNDLTNELLENPEKMVSIEINEAFDNYLNSCIRHFELQEIGNNTNAQKNEDEDMLFGGSQTINNSVENTMKSYWGKSIRKI